MEQNSTDLIVINDRIDERESRYPEEFKFEICAKSLNQKIWIYKCRKKILYTDENKSEAERIIEFELFWKKDEYKDMVRISSIRKLEKQGNWSEMKKTEFFKYLPYLTKLLFDMNLYFKEEIEKYAGILPIDIPSSLIYESKLNKVYIPVGREIDLSSQQIIDLINNINEKKQQKVWIESSIVSLNKFIGEFEKLMNKENSNENEFQQLMYNNPQILTLIFGVENSAKIEKEFPLSEGEENRIDLLVGNNLIIELKKPNTKLFYTDGDRNNISGLSAKLVSAVNQLHLYMEKLNREKSIDDPNFSKGILIIGSDKQFKEKEDYTAWKFFREPYKFQIITYDNFLNSLKKLKNNLEQIKENNDKD